MSVLRRISQRPMAVATLQATALGSLSNVLAQLLRRYRTNAELDVTELLRFVVIAIITCPPNYLWQAWIEKKFPGYPPAPAKYRHPEEGLPLDSLEKDVDLDEDNGSNAITVAREQKPRLSIKNTAKKMFIDTFTLGALANTIVFLVLMGCLKGFSLDHIRENIYTQTIPIIVAGYKIWPFAAVFSFTVVPVERRIVFLSFVGLLWGIYMSLVAMDL